MTTRHSPVRPLAFRFTSFGETGTLLRPQTEPFVSAIVPTGRWSSPADPPEEKNEDGLMQRLYALGWETIPMTGDYVWRLPQGE